MYLIIRALLAYGFLFLFGCNQFQTDYKIENYAVRIENQSNRYEPRYSDGNEYDFVIRHANQRIFGKCLSANKCQELSNRVGETIPARQIGNWASTNGLEYRASYGQSELIEVTEVRDLR